MGGGGLVRAMRVANVGAHAEPHFACAKLQVQLEKLTATFRKVPEDLRHHFSVDGEQILEDGAFGKSPSLSPRFGRTTGFSLPERPTMASSGEPF